tara:strand:+ start:244 stop:699 length:456 start_codon:yes stop_codon:yes gene_type:complete
MEKLESEDPYKEYPSNRGQKWSDEEETLLLEELNKSMSIELIAETHKRTIGGIKSRQREIAFKMHSKDIPMKEIIEKTKIEEEDIKQTIAKRKNQQKGKIKQNSTDSELVEIKTEIKELNNTIKKLSKTMDAIYELILADMDLLTKVVKYT